MFMKIAKVKLDFIRMSLVNFIDFCLYVIECMEANLLFPKPNVPIADVKTSVTNLSDKHTLALSGNLAAKEGVAIARKATTKLMKKNASYVDLIAEGDEEIIKSSGYHPTKQPKPAKRPEFRVLEGADDGSVVLICKAVDNAASYAWQFVPNPLPEDEKLWTYAGFSTQTKCVIENLDSGTKYWFRVAAITPLGRMPWCKPIMKVVP
jgi:hypothetical protein